MPKVSVIIPAYNMKDLTIETIKSVLAQTYNDFEIIVVDDGSSDGTGEALQGFGDQIKYYYKENGGACSARNYGIQKANGELLAFVDCDDLWLPQKLEQSVKEFEADAAVGLVYTNGYFINEKGEVISRYRGKRPAGWVGQKLIVYNFIFNPSVMIRKKCLSTTGLFDESIFIPADWDLWLRIAESFKIKHLSALLVKYRVRSDYHIKNPTRLLNEGERVVSKAFERNPTWPRWLRRLAVSNLKLITAGYFFGDGAYWSGFKYYALALIDFPLNFRLLTFWFKQLCVILGKAKC